MKQTSGFAPIRQFLSWIFPRRLSPDLKTWITPHSSTGAITLRRAQHSQRADMIHQSCVIYLAAITALPTTLSTPPNIIIILADDLGKLLQQWAMLLEVYFSFDRFPWCLLAQRRNHDSNHGGAGKEWDHFGKCLHATHVHSLEGITVDRLLSYPHGKAGEVCKIMGLISNIWMRTSIQDFVIKSQEPRGLHTNFTLLSGRLRDMGYRTHAIGKWVYS